MTISVQPTLIQVLAATALQGLFSIATADDVLNTNTSALDSRLTPPALSLAAKDWPALRTWFHQPTFNHQDGLDDYADDYRQTAALPSARLTAR